MLTLWRILVVLSVALLLTQRVSAHAHPVDSGFDAASRVATMHANAVAHADGATHCAHCHASCCATMCGVHCGALFSAYRFEPHTPDASLPLPSAEPHRADFSRAPPLRPPIA